MIENLIVDRVEGYYYKVTPQDGYLIAIPADESEIALAMKNGKVAEDYITTVAYLPLSYDFTINPIGLKAINK